MNQCPVNLVVFLTVDWDAKCSQECVVRSLAAVTCQCKTLINVSIAPGIVWKRGWIEEMFRVLYRVDRFLDLECGVCESGVWCSGGRQ